MTYRAVAAIGVGEGAGVMCPQIREKCFSGNYYVKFWHFRAKIRKFGNFVNFRANVIKIWVF